MVVYYAARLFKVDRIVLEGSPLGSAQESAESTYAPAGVVARPNATGPGTVIFLIVEPIAQIMLGTVGQFFTVKGSMAHSVLSFLGSSMTALLTATLLAYLIVGYQQKWNLVFFKHEIAWVEFCHSFGKGRLCLLSRGKERGEFFIHRNLNNDRV